MGQPVITKAIDNAGPYPITAPISCRRVLVQENYNSVNPPTADLQQFNPDGSGPIAIPKGTPMIFAKGPYIEGQLVGQANTAAGSVTVQIIGSMEI